MCIICDFYTFLVKIHGHGGTGAGLEPLPDSGRSAHGPLGPDPGPGPGPRLHRSWAHGPRIHENQKDVQRCSEQFPGSIVSRSLF